jgi:hypothetical protein
MRYLNKREDFLKKKQHIQGVPYETLLEVASNAGPFANDVGWNDSLLGRLINHVIRKARIAAKVPRIKSLISQLKDEFEQIVGQAKIYSLSSEDQQLVIQIELDVFFKELIYAVENNFKVGILKGLTDGCIKRVTDMAEFDKKAVLLEELKKFREFLDQFKDDQGSNDDEEDKEDDKDSTDKSTDKSTDTGAAGTGYVTMVKNLKALALILANYTKVNTKVSTSTKTGKPISTYITVAGDTLVKIQNNPKINPNKLDTVTIRSKNPGKLDKYKQDNITMAAGITLVMEATVDTIGTGGSANRGTVVAGEDHLTQAFNKLKKDIEVLISTKEKGIGVDYKFINDIATNSNNTSNKELIKNLYNEINRYLVGDKKATIQEKDKLYTEGIEVLNDKNKIVVVAEKIARFSKRALQFEKENLYGGLGDLKVPLQTFVTTLREINKLPIVTAKKESLFDYYSFLEAKNILDNQGGGQAAPSGDDNKPTTTGTASQTQGKDDNKDNVDDVSAKILEFFNKTCIEVRAYTVSDEERKSIQTKIDQVKTEDGKKIEMTIDPIIAIMNLFIKAYKIYTVKTITKRTEAVDTNTLSEYTSFGQSGEDGGKTGPYRNNKLFDMWEEAVNNIRKDRKYQAIFTDNANLRLPKVTDPDPANPEDWTIKPKAGASFRKFINDVLDGDTLYKNASTTGAVATFIEKYFGDGTVSEGKAGTDIDSAALVECGENATAIAANSVKLELKKQSTITPDKNIFFTIEGMRPKDASKPDVFDESVQRTFFIDQITASEVWLIGTTYLKRFNPYLDSLEPKHEISQGDFSKNLTNDTRGELYYTKITVEDFKKLKSNQKLSMTTQDTKGALSEVNNIQITNVYTLNKVDDGELYKLSDEQRTKFNGILNKAGIKSDIKAAIVTGAKINTI